MWYYTPCRYGIVADDKQYCHGLQVQEICAKWGNLDSKASNNWFKMAQVSNQLNTKRFTIGDLDLLTSRTTRKHLAEEYIMTITKVQPLPPSQLHHAGSNWASDRSMTPAVSGIRDLKSVIAALTGPLTMVLQILGRNILIPEGELVGLIAELMMMSGDTQSTMLHTYYVNSVWFISDLGSRVGQENKLRTMNGWSYY